VTADSALNHHSHCCKQQSLRRMQVQMLGHTHAPPPLSPTSLLLLHQSPPAPARPVGPLKTTRAAPPPTPHCNNLSSPARGMSSHPLPAPSTVDAADARKKKAPASWEKQAAKAKAAEGSVALTRPFARSPDVCSVKSYPFLKEGVLQKRAPKSMVVFGGGLHDRYLVVDEQQGCWSYWNSKERKMAKEPAKKQAVPLRGCWCRVSQVDLSIKLLPFTGAGLGAAAFEFVALKENFDLWSSSFFRACAAANGAAAAAAAQAAVRRAWLRARFCRARVGMNRLAATAKMRAQRTRSAPAAVTGKQRVSLLLKLCAGEKSFIHNTLNDLCRTCLPPPPLPHLSSTHQPTHAHTTLISPPSPLQLRTAVPQPAGEQHGGGRGQRGAGGRGGCAG